MRSVNSEVLDVKACGTLKELHQKPHVSSFLSQMTLRHEDGDESADPPPSGRKDRRRASLGAGERRGLERRRSRRHSVQNVKSTLSAPASPCSQSNPGFVLGHGQHVEDHSER